MFEGTYKFINAIFKKFIHIPVIPLDDQNIHLKIWLKPCGLSILYLMSCMYISTGYIIHICLDEHLDCQVIDVLPSLPFK